MEYLTDLIVVFGNSAGVSKRFRCAWNLVFLNVLSFSCISVVCTAVHASSVTRGIYTR